MCLFWSCASIWWVGRRVSTALAVLSGGAEHEEKLSPEEWVDVRRREKRLVDCALPAGMRLETPRPRQFVLNGLPKWGFCLRFDAGVAGVFWHVQEYLNLMADDLQMQFAVREFRAKLEAEGIRVGEAPEGGVGSRLQGWRGRGGDRTC